MMRNRALLPMPYSSSRSVGKPSCRVCSGTGWEVLEFRSTNLARRCRCRRERDEAFWIETVGIPIRYVCSQWKNILQEGLLPSRTRQKIQNYLRKDPDIPSTLFIIGDQAAMATQVSVAILKEITRTRKRTVSYVDCWLAGQEDQQEVAGKEKLAAIGKPEWESADLVIFDRLFDPEISISSQLKLAELLHRRYLSQRHQIIPLDIWTSRSLRVALCGKSRHLIEELLQAMKSLASDSLWCWLAPMNRGIKAESILKSRGAVA